MYRFFLLFVITLLFCSAVAVANPLATLKFERLTIDEGLSQNTVTVTYQDRQGFIWIGTTDGLNRYDGHQFRVFRHQPDQPDTISSNVISAIFEDSAGVLWIGTDAGLNRFERHTERFRHFKHDANDHNSLSHDTVTAITQFKSGDLWVATF